MINYITGVFCLVVILIAGTTCSEIRAKKAIELEKLYTASGQSRMDIACSRISYKNASQAAGQAAVCVAYFNNKKVYKEK